ncbi:MAG: hypothetical protein QY307_08035 [Acidimicrobiia bacterium]|nr:MAG: hypothetical protein QY307_08035 [Acidimicrobiia bacterium]
MLPFPDRHELARRLPRLFLGLVEFGLGLALMVASGLGLPPWEVLHQGISRHVPIPLGTVGIITGLLVLLLWIPLRERVGVGTLLNAVLIGVAIDLTLLWLRQPEAMVLRWGFLVAGLLLIGSGSGFYIGAGMGPGPRDGLMTGLARRGVSVGVVRTFIEVTVLAAGWLLGGTVGVGTVLFSLGVGPVVQFFLVRLSMEPLPEAA